VLGWGPAARASEESGWLPPPEAGGSGGSGSVSCESRDEARRRCAVPNIDPGSVYLERKLSQSSGQRGTDGGADRDGIWVDRGCRADFRYSRYGGPSGGGGAFESRMRSACIDRAAREWAVTRSSLEIAGSERLQNRSYRFNLQSKRLSGACMVDRSANVYRFDTR
jgi:hypothetical protein